MLKLLNEENLSDILDFCKNSILGTRISCYALCYGFERNFLMFWGSNGTEGLNTVIAKFYDDVTVITSNASDLNEVSEFTTMLGYKTLTTGAHNARLMNFDKYIVKKGYKFETKEFAEHQCEAASEGDFKQIYSLVSKSIPNSFSDTKEAYLEFLSDYTFRFYKGYANAVCIREGENVVACAMTAAQSNDSALISGVACDEKFRKSGLGKKVVLSLADKMIKENKDVFIIALNESAEGFYEHIGFKEVEKIAFIDRKV